MDKAASLVRQDAWSIGMVVAIFVVPVVAFARNPAALTPVGLQLNSSVVGWMLIRGMPGVLYMFKRRLYLEHRGRCWAACLMMCGLFGSAFHHIVLSGELLADLRAAGYLSRAAPFAAWEFLGMTALLRLSATEQVFAAVGAGLNCHLASVVAADGPYSISTWMLLALASCGMAVAQDSVARRSWLKQQERAAGKGSGIHHPLTAATRGGAGGGQTSTSFQGASLQKV